MERCAPQLNISPKVETSLNLSQAAIYGLELLTLPIDLLESAIAQKIDENPALSVVTREKKKRRSHNHLLVENQLTKQPSLFEHLMKQAGEEFSRGEMPIAQEIAGNLNEKGFLDVDVGEISRVCNVTEIEVEKILSRMHHFDPLGVAARDVRQALIIQAKAKKYRCAQIVLTNFYDQLLHGRYLEIGKALEITIEEVREIIQREVKKLNPFPGHGYDISHVITRRPELEIHREGDKWIVTHANDVLQTVVISNDFIDDGDLWKKKKLSEAAEFIEAISKRQSLLVRLVMKLIQVQGAYLLGESELLSPLLISDLAEEFDVVTSTLSRLISNKTIDTPRGLVVLRDLFTQKIDHSCDDSVSKQRAKYLLKTLIDNESRKKPVRDNELVKQLDGEHGISLSRRTIAKYRSEMGIPNASHRHEDRY